jgi:AraC-like DNA-binding protein
MRRYVQYNSFNVYSFEVASWPHPAHKHTYFEIIFINKGNGKHVLNCNSFHYQEHDVFLLGPEDFHYFEIDDPTSFTYIRFTEVFVHEISSSKNKSWQAIAEFLLNTAPPVSGSVVNKEADKGLLDHLLHVLKYEYDHRDDATYEVMMEGLMKSIFTILKRNINKPSSLTGTKTPELIESIVAYLRMHIYSPEHLRIEHLAEVFHYSAGYLSVYFKKQIGEPLQQYILKYKLTLVEDRLKYSSKNIAEITDEFGFADESHLNKLFKKYYALSPGAYRKRLNTENKKDVS